MASNRTPRPPCCAISQSLAPIVDDSAFLRENDTARTTTEGLTVSAAQWDAMYDAYQYGVQKGVSVQYVIVPNDPVPDVQP
jgi:hypothetical protein